MTQGRQELSNAALNEFRDHVLRPHGTFKICSIQGIEGLVTIASIVGKNFSHERKQTNGSPVSLTAMYTPVIISNNNENGPIYTVCGYNADGTHRLEQIPQDSAIQRINLTDTFSFSGGQAQVEYRNAIQ